MPDLRKALFGLRPRSGARKNYVGCGSAVMAALLLLLGLIAPNDLRAELILSQFTGTNLIKIMPVGDSITDDCSISGAWRAPLQPMLDTNGIPYTNTGRIISPAMTGFTKRRHEGYCGSVIGPPGVFAVYNYTTTNAYLQKIVADALAITANRPDVILVLIGANDIGRGRNPWTVATNHMPGLLSVIFSNVPDAHVILAKTTTLQDAGLGYGPYATNVPIYNAALQRLVNERRALGQKVFLADMFSAVDYGTMFLSDHLHPNALGLRAIAAEWLTRIQSICVRPDRITSLFINGGAEWAYSDTGQDLGSTWAQPDYDDSGWSRGIARLGYGDLTTATPINYGPDPTNKFITTYFRRSFVVPWNAIITNLNFRLARTGGAIVWLNGQEIFRVNLPAGPINSSTPAQAQMPGFTPHIFYPTNVPISNLPPGTNLIVIEIHQPSPTNSAMGFDMELIGSGNLMPLPTLSIARTGDDFRFSWPLTNGSGFALYSTTNLDPAAVWVPAPGLSQTNGAEIVLTSAPDAATRYYRLQR